MSGFVGLINLDGAPVDSDLLWKLTRSIAYRGPDKQEVHILGNVGFGHTMLRTGPDSLGERQPCTLDGHTWIAAHCRVDAREDLIGKLAAHGRRELSGATDPELILHAYAVWGTDCVDHLLGDFAFAIWDARERRFFCGRDHLGIKLFYYARVGNCLIFSNTLNSLRLHPAVSDRLNDRTIGDFLLFGLNQDQTTTSFQDIQRLPPGHTLVLSDSGLRTGKYWTLPIEQPLRYRRSEDYVEHFLDLLRTVVKDRVRTDKVAVLMSGGLDSSGLAAIAKESGAQVYAATAVFDRLIPDRERHYAGAVAAHLGIPIDFHVRDNDNFFEGCRTQENASPDPAHVPFFGPESRFGELGLAAKRAPVVLYGEGPDNALWYEWKPYVSNELKRLHFFRLFKELVSFPFIFRQLPFAGRAPRVAEAPQDQSAGDGFPLWLNPEFSEKFGLRRRFDDVRHSQNPVHPAHPTGYASFVGRSAVPLWQDIFERYDSGVSAVPVEVRHPYADVRMLRYLLSVPVLPWCRNKNLLRRAFEAYLPAEIVWRAKSPLAGDPVLERRKETFFANEPLTPQALEYIDFQKLQNVHEFPAAFWIDLRPGTLNWFLRMYLFVHSIEKVYD
jgi:asparagine synthase (glutamine-hydrolysing)